MYARKGARNSAVVYVVRKKVCKMTGKKLGTTEAGQVEMK